ncbi:tetratricopeptide repeat protein [Pontibacter harenae]|uniref:tetratricopeptide repeat protein n=1 Tax=Pontibacter harenae TaxID=2894083 RepID=UPI001E2F93AB|nr:tetratricopeptide repeat protein [Pontibacter harenae]MCC9166955.1 tetratricopeptide repeat protein [Pontibacter harenae]
MRSVYRLCLNLLGFAVIICCSACNAEKAKEEQMVALQEVKDNPEAQLANLNAAIAKSKRDASLFTRRAVILFKNNDLSKALEDINDAIRLAKSEPYNLFVKAQILRAMGRYEEALPLALQAERNSYHSSSLYVLLGELYLRRLNYAEAREYIEKAQELSPSNEYAFYFKGRIMAAVGDTVRAIDNFQAALKHNSELMEPKRELAGIYVGQFNLQAAQPFLNKAYKQAPTDAKLLLYKGIMYQQTQKADSAQLFFRKAVAQNDTLKEAHYKLGILLYAQGDNAGAVEHLQKVADRYRGTTKYHVTLASSYERTGQYLNALQEYQRLIKVEPNYSYAYQAIARIKAKLQRPSTDSTAVRNRTIDNRQQEDIHD